MLVAAVINGSYHGNSNSAGPNMVAFIHPPRQHISTQKMNGQFKISISLNMCPTFQYDDIYIHT